MTFLYRVDIFCLYLIIKKLIVCVIYERKGIPMFQSSKKQLPHSTAYSLLLDDLEKARYDLSLAYDNFQNAMDPDMIDCCIYQVNALQMRYKFLLTRVKQLTPEECVNEDEELSLQKV